MKKWFVFLLVAAIALPTHATEIWVTLPDLTTRSELDKSVTSHRAQIHESDFISAYDALLRRPVPPSTLSQILNLEEQGQTLTLNGKFRSALHVYADLRKILEGIPNVAGVERIAFATFVHLAELHDILKDEESEVAWKQAHAWFRLASLETKEFSPKTIARLKGIHLIAAAQIEVRCPNESSVYVDGQLIPQIEGHFAASFEPGYHQISVLTPGSEWLVKSVRLRGHETREVEFNPEPTIEGTCEDPHYVGHSLPPKTKLLVSFGQCDRVFYDQTWFTVNGHRLESLMPKPSAGSMMTEMEAVPEEKSWVTSLTQSKWFWIGLGIVAVGASAAAIQNQNQQVTYTQTNSIR